MNELETKLESKQDDPTLEEWRRLIRGRVTALKCHIMASRGLTSDGHIIAPYSAKELYKKKANAEYLMYADETDLQDYVTTAMLMLCNNGETSQDVASSDVDITINALDPNKIPVSINCLNRSLEEPESQNSDSSEGLSSSFTDSTTANESSLRQQSNTDSSSDTRDSKRELDIIKMELKEREYEIKKLSKIRDNVEGELQDLTANLFQEAHNMVQDANQRAAAADKSWKESNMQVEVLQAEVTALKTLVLTSTPSAPNPHLHPQIIAKGAQAVIAEAGKIFHRGHKKSPSDFDLKYGRETTPPTSPHKEFPLYDSNGTKATFPMDPECWEIDPVVHREFVQWRQEPMLSREDQFMARIYSEDIDFCLSFPNSVLGHKVQGAIEENALFIEEVNPRQKSSCPRKCVLLDVPRYCKYRFRLGDSESNWYYICQLARNRIIAVCDFLNYLRYIKLGLVKSSIHDAYWEIVKLRRQMSLARLGF